MTKSLQEQKHLQEFGLLFQGQNQPLCDQQTIIYKINYTFNYF